MKEGERSTRQPEPARLARSTFAALAVLALGLTGSLGAWHYARQQIAREMEASFHHEVARAAGLIERRVRDSVNLLTGLRGLFSASDEVTRAEFDQYLANFRLAQYFPGVRALSHARYLAQGEKTAFERRMRRESGTGAGPYHDYAIHPAGEREEYLPIAYIHPLAGNETALGLDLAADPARREEIARARDSGEPVASAPFAATIRPEAVSFAVRMAVYRRGRPLATPEQRREAFTGIVAVVIGVEELVTGPLGRLLGTRYDLVIHDFGHSDSGGLAEPQKLLFDSRRLFGAQAANEPDSALAQDVTLEVGGRIWRLAFRARADSAPGAGVLLPRIVLAGGFFTSLLLFWLVYSLSLARERALQLAVREREMREAQVARDQLAFIQQLIGAVPLPIFFKDAVERRYRGVNSAWEKFFGIPRSAFLGKTVFDLYPNNPEIARYHHAKDEELFAAPGSQSYEATIVTARGEVRHVIYNKATFDGSDGRAAGLIGVITDVTSLKQAEAALRESEARFRDLTELSSDWYWEQDAELRFTLVSSKIEDSSMYAAEAIGRRRWELPVIGVTEEQWQAHKEQLLRREPFENFVYQRYDRDGQLRTISVSGRPIFDQQGRFLGYRGIGRDITEQRRAEEQIRHMAHHDALTGLPNRALLEDRIRLAIAQSQRSGRPAALLFIDLDRFKDVNDSLGHQAGDELLKAVASRILECTRGTDTVARIGGDEFVVVLTELHRQEEAGVVAQKLLAALSEPVEIAGHRLRVTPSIGISIHPGDGEDAQTLMKNADTAMYRAKERGRNNYQFFAAEMNAAVQPRL